eukprot:CAMPEP_0179331606 /NCGR_PEP_ID=MMETSP0797-20121207/64280_1 /TAXON_ID=47934 /ORGANISM="Dinophysis acuminata, Strain DAEP01" /LENGTH=192 /DNA_ID=CAMNT_0021044399 /DNA_START=113 /DNA_END=689 /DNA_ORIENTATION=-
MPAASPLRAVWCDITACERMRSAARGGLAANAAPRAGFRQLARRRLARGIMSIGVHLPIRMAVELAHVLHPGRPDRFRRRRKGDLHAAREDRGLALVRHCGVHDRAVPVALHVGLEALAGAAPAHAAHLLARADPVPVAVELRPQYTHDRRADQVHEGVAHAGPASEVDRQVDEVVEPGEAFRIQHVQEVLF